MNGWTDREGWHDNDCGGWPACNGCGWIDSDLFWWPGPCPDGDRPHQAARSELGMAFDPEHRLRADSLLANLMRRVINADGYVFCGRYDDGQPQAPHLTLDLTIEITDEELAALDAARFADGGRTPEEWRPGGVRP